MPDHIHMLLSLPPRYSVAMTIGYLGQECDPDPPGAVENERDVVRPEFRARGFCGSTVGLDEDQIRRYIRDQEKLQQDQNQGELNFDITQRPLQGGRRGGGRGERGGGGEGGREGGEGGRRGEGGGGEGRGGGAFLIPPALPVVAGCQCTPYDGFNPDRSRTRPGRGRSARPAGGWTLEGSGIAAVHLVFPAPFGRALQRRGNRLMAPHSRLATRLRNCRCPSDNGLVGISGLSIRCATSAVADQPVWQGSASIGSRPGQPQKSRMVWTYPA